MCVVVIPTRTNGDSFFEYLLKMYVLWGDLEYFDMFMQCYVSVQVGRHTMATIRLGAGERGLLDGWGREEGDETSKRK